MSNTVHFPLVLRIPGWCSNATITVNGQLQTAKSPASFFRIQRTWANGDLVVVNLPMPIQTRRAEPAEWPSIAGRWFIR